MEKLNLPPFYIGQKVVCVEQSTNGTLCLNKIYTVTGTTTHCHCGVVVNVNNIGERGSMLKKIEAGQLVTCPTCRVTYTSNGLQYFLSSRFAPIQRQKFPLMTFSEIKQTEKKEILINN